MPSNVVIATVILSLLVVILFKIARAEYSRIRNNRKVSQEPNPHDPIEEPRKECDCAGCTVIRGHGITDKHELYLIDQVIQSKFHQQKLLAEAEVYGKMTKERINVLVNIGYDAVEKLNEEQEDKAKEINDLISTIKRNNHVGKHIQ